MKMITFADTCGRPAANRSEISVRPQALKFCAEKSFADGADAADDEMPNRSDRGLCERWNAPLLWN
jgi:hypothetical protein